MRENCPNIYEDNPKVSEDVLSIFCQSKPLPVGKLGEYFAEELSFRHTFQPVIALSTNYMFTIIT